MATELDACVTCLGWQEAVRREYILVDLRRIDWAMIEKNEVFQLHPQN